MGVEGDAVDDGGEPWVGEDGPPFAEGKVGRDADACPFFALGDDLEQQLGSAGIDLDVAELGYMELDRRGAELLFQI